MVILPLGVPGGIQPLDKNALIDDGFSRIAGTAPHRIAPGNLKAWYDPDTLDLDHTAAVSTWSDQSPNGFDMTASGTVQYARGAINGRNGVYVNGGTLTNASLSLSGGGCTWLGCVIPFRPNQQDVFLATTTPANGNFFLGSVTGLGINAITGNITRWPFGPGPTVLSAVLTTGNVSRLGINGAEVSSTNAQSSGTLTGFTFGSVGFPLNALLGRWYFWNTALTSQQIASAYRWLAGYYGINLVDYEKPLIVFDGNSIPFGLGASNMANAYVERCMSRLPGVQYRNLCRPSFTTTSLNTEAAAKVDVLYDPRRARNILVFFEGTNEISAANIATYCTARQSVGWEVLVCTPIDKSGSSAAIQTQNATIRSNYRSYAKALIDFGNDPRLGQTNSANNGTYISSPHPVDLGHEIMSETLYNGIASYLRSVPPYPTYKTHHVTTVPSASAVLQQNIPLRSNATYKIKVQSQAVLLSAIGATYTETQTSYQILNQAWLVTVNNSGTVASPIDITTSEFPSSGSAAGTFTTSSIAHALTANGTSVDLSITGTAATNIKVISEIEVLTAF